MYLKLFGNHGGNHSRLKGHVKFNHEEMIVCIKALYRAVLSF